MRSKMNWPQAIKANKWLVAACAALFLLLFFLALSIDQGFEQNARLRQEASNSYDDRAALQAVLMRHQDIEIGQRGYVITGDVEFLEPYQNAERRIDASLDTFEKLSGDGDQAALIDRLRRVSA